MNSINGDMRTIAEKEIYELIMIFQEFSNDRIILLIVYCMFCNQQYSTLQC